MARMEPRCAGPGAFSPSALTSAPPPPPPHIPYALHAGGSVIKGEPREHAQEKEPVAMMRASPLLLLLAVLTALALVLQGARAQEVEAQVRAEGEGEEGGAGGAGRKAGLFQRIARVLDTGAAEDDDGLPIDWEASKDEGMAVDPNQVTYTEVDDAWGFDLGLKMIQKTLDGDPTGAFREMIGATKDLKDAWMVPTVFKFIMNQMPIFQAIKPMAAIAKKDTITAQDVRACVRAWS